MVWAIKFLIALLRPKTRKLVEKDTKIAVLLLDLGTIQVFTRQTEAEIAAITPYTEVYWQSTITQTAHGPFASVFGALVHYSFPSLSRLTPDIVALPSVNKPAASIISVDFKTRKRR
jgi:hypothetical protein